MNRSRLLENLAIFTEENAIELSARDSQRLCYLSYEFFLEIEKNTPVVELIFESIAQIHDDPEILGLVLRGIEELAKLDRNRTVTDGGQIPDRVQRAFRLDRALNLYFMGLEPETIAATRFPKGPHGKETTLLDHLKQKRTEVDDYKVGFMGLLYVRCLRPRQSVGAQWPLFVIAESLFRGRDPDDAPASEHRLLPQLLKEVQADPHNPERKHLLQGSLSLFLGALEDLTPYADLDVLRGQGNVIKHARDVVKWTQSGDAMNVG